MAAALVKKESLEPHAYWRANLRIIGLLLAVWLVVGLLLSVVFVETLNRFSLGGYPLGFWLAQQGSIYVFIVLIFVYAKWMDRVDRSRRTGAPDDDHEDER